MKILILTFIAIVTQATLAATNLNRLNKNGVALCQKRTAETDADCYDPVSYFTDHKAVKAGAKNSKLYRAQFDGATYVFVSQSHLDEFNKTPEKYVPQFGGWCAYAVATSKEKVDIDPKSFLIQDGKLLLFYDSFFNDTRKTWSSDKEKDAKTYLSEAVTNWPTVKEKAP